MSEESLEEKINSENDSTFWDFFVGAYSSSRAIRVLISTLTAGYGYIASIATSVGFYFATKTIGIATKYIAGFIRNPFGEHDLIDFIKKNIGQYIPWGKQKRPHAIGGGLSLAYSLTGF